MISQQLQHHARTLQRRAGAVTALLVTLFLLCIEHVRAFASQYHLSAHDAMVLASAASSLTRRLSATCLSGEALKGTLPKTAGVFNSPGRAVKAGGERSSTRLRAWSIPVIAVPALPSLALPTSKDLPLHTLGSWYTEVDPTTKPPVYDDDYDSSYSFRSPTDDWPSMSADADDASSAAPARGPLRRIGRITGRVKDIFVQ